MANALKTRSRRTRPSLTRSSANRPPITTPIFLTGATINDTVLTLTFNQAVVLRGVPRYTLTGATATPVSAAMPTPTSVAITFDGPLTGLSSIAIPYEEPAVRNASGGFVGTSRLDLP